MTDTDKNADTYDRIRDRVLTTITNILAEERTDGLLALPPILVGMLFRTQRMQLDFFRHVGASQSTIEQATTAFVELLQSDIAELKQFAETGHAGTNTTH
ncbi:hypothetical protein [Pasteurella testudinis]|uniref:hypothetical protein n=1 Tax=Pasteurella testudinis TaxID=761 RepID=UPI004059465B